MDRSVYRGSLNGLTQEEASARLEEKHNRYKKALELKGDVIYWRRGTDLSGKLKEEFGYFNHEETETYQVFEHTQTESKKEVDYERDCYVTVNTAIYEPCTKVLRTSDCLKVVKRGKREKVRSIEQEFTKTAAIFYAVKDGFSEELPNKKIAVAYNLLLLLSGILILISMFFGPSVLPEYAQTFAGDLFLLKFISGYAESVSGYAALVYVTFVLGLACAVGAFCSGKYLSRFKGAPGLKDVITYAVATIAAFAFGFLLNEGYKELADTNNPLLWIPIGLFALGRIISVAMALYFIFKSVLGLITGSPYKKICTAVTSNADMLNEYIDSGAYKHDCDLLDELAGYTVNVTEETLAEITAVLAKINEFERKKAELIRIENTEFTDKKAEIEELEKRLAKAESRLSFLTNS